jgi:transcription elongation factor GreA
VSPVDHGETVVDHEITVSIALEATHAKRSRNGGVDDVILTAEGYEKLKAEHDRLTTVKRPEAAARLGSALQLAGELADNTEYLDARAELDFVEERIALLERRLHAARVLRPEETSNEVVCLGSLVVLEDLDDSTRDEYVLVSSAEADPIEGRLSSESPVGKAITGHHRGDVIDARAPHGVRHLRIADVRAR